MYGPALVSYRQFLYVSERNPPAATSWPDSFPACRSFGSYPHFQGENWLVGAGMPYDVTADGKRFIRLRVPRGQPKSGRRLPCHLEGIRTGGESLRSVAREQRSDRNRGRRRSAVGGERQVLHDHRASKLQLGAALRPGRASSHLLLPSINREQVRQRIPAAVAVPAARRVALNAKLSGAQGESVLRPRPGTS